MRILPPKKACTILDLARASEFSTCTVSKALSGAPGVNAVTRARIEGMARRLGYVPKAAASALRGGHPPVVGVFAYFEESWAPTQILWGMGSELPQHKL